MLLIRMPSAIAKFSEGSASGHLPVLQTSGYERPCEPGVPSAVKAEQAWSCDASHVDPAQISQGHRCQRVQVCM